MPWAETWPAFTTSQTPGSRPLASHAALGISKVWSVAPQSGTCFGTIQPC